MSDFVPYVRNTWQPKSPIRTAWMNHMEMGIWNTSNALQQIMANGGTGHSGRDGKDGTNGRDGIDGKDGKDGHDGVDGRDGVDGKNATATMYNILDYGAVSGNKSIDTGKIINQIMADHMAPEGMTIVIPVGTFYVNTPINPTHNYTTITGVNRGLRSNIDPETDNPAHPGGGSHLVLNDGVDAAVKIGIKGASPRITGVQISDLVITGFGSGVAINAVQDNDGIKCSDLVICNVDTGIILNGADAPVITGCWVSELPNAIQLLGSSQQAMITNNDIGGQPKGISLKLDSPQFATISGNNIYPDGMTNIEINSGTIVNITGNNIQSYYTGAVKMSGNNILFANNVVYARQSNGVWLSDPINRDGKYGLIHIDGDDIAINANHIISEQPADDTRILVASGNRVYIQNTSIAGNGSVGKVVFDGKANDGRVSGSIRVDEFLDGENHSNVLITDGPRKTLGTLTSDEQAQLSHLSTSQGWSNDLQTIMWNDAGYWDVYFLHTATGALDAFGEAESTGQNWNHTTTTDFITFTPQNNAIKARGNEGDFTYKSAWTGCVVKNKGNIAGVPNGAYVAFICGLMKGDGAQNIYGVWSNDGGKSFENSLYDTKPLIDHTWSWGPTNHSDLRDPTVFYDGNTLYMYAAEGNEIGIYKSNNGINWSAVTKLKPDTFFKGRNWDGNAPIECPVIRRMKVNGSNDSKVVLFIGAQCWQDNETKGTYYTVGRIDNGVFVAETTTKRFDLGTDYYGANFEGVDDINTVKSSIIAMSWVGNWDWQPTTVRPYQNYTGKPALRLGSYSSPRVVTLNSDLSVSQRFAYSEDELLIAMVSRGNAGSFSKTNEPANRKYDVTVSSDGGAIDSVEVFVGQKKDFVKLVLGSNGSVVANSNASELNPAANAGYSKERRFSTKYNDKRKMAIQIATDKSSLELLTPSGDVYTVSRFSISDEQDISIVVNSANDTKPIIDVKGYDYNA